jgi:hypothetical protein
VRIAWFCLTQMWFEQLADCDSLRLSYLYKSRWQSVYSQVSLQLSIYTENFKANIKFVQKHLWVKQQNKQHFKDSYVRLEVWVKQ